MQGWHTPFLGLRDIPREFSDFELQAFFSFSRTDHELIARRRGDSHRLGFALHIGFVRMSGRPLNSVRAVPAALLRHLGRELGIAVPDLASLRALYLAGEAETDNRMMVMIEALRKVIMWSCFARLFNPATPPMKSTSNSLHTVREICCVGLRGRPPSDDGCVGCRTDAFDSRSYLS